MLDPSFLDQMRDQSDTIFKSAGFSLSVAIIGVPYIQFGLPGSQFVPPSWFGFMNFWLLIGGITMLISLVRDKFRTVSAKCPKCGNAIEEVKNPKWHCTICKWKQT